MIAHIPVLQKEAILYLNPQANKNFIDATVGGAGHARLILEKNGPQGKVLGIERDPEVYKKISGLNIDRLILANDSFINLKQIAERNNLKEIDGILLDLGMSSWHLEESGRGFSFLKDEPLDMRYDISQELTAEKIINYWPEPALEKILREYGEERFSRQVAQKIVEFRKIKQIKTALQLTEIINKVVPGRKMHAATRSFQALRIAVNDELGALEKTLPQALDVLGRGGRLVVISFHSLEDRIVKNFIKEGARQGRLQILTKKPLGPTREEIKANPRSRSAKLRAAEKY